MNVQKTFGESVGLVLRRIAWGLWLILPTVAVILLGVWIVTYGFEVETPKPTPLAVKKVELENVYFYESMQKTSCDVVIAFDQPVVDYMSGQITVAFYDSKGKLLETETRTFISSYHEVYALECYFTVKGYVSYCEITDYTKVKTMAEVNYAKAVEKAEEDRESATIGFAVLFAIWLFLRCLYIVPLFVTSFFLKCRTCKMGNDDVTIYAGRIHHYIKINGEKCAACDQLISTKPIFLQYRAMNGDTLDVLITPVTKHISIRTTKAEPNLGE